MKLKLRKYDGILEKNFLIVIICAIVMVLLVDIQNSSISRQEPILLKDLVYNKNELNEQFGYTIFIEENGELQPYYVLTENYYSQGNVLLLRKYLLEERMSFHDEMQEAEYGRSNIDSFLNKEFISRLDSPVKDSIPKTSISVSAIRLPFHYEKDKKNNDAFISRRIFLLSRNEVRKSRLKSGEDTFLSFFEKDISTNQFRAVKKGERIPFPWILRSTFEFEPHLVGVVGFYGQSNVTSVVSSRGIRPAFCLPPNTKIRKDVLENKEIYVLDIG